MLSICIALISCASGDEKNSYLAIASQSTSIDERIKIYEEALLSFPDDMRAYYNLAYLYLYEKDYEEAERVLKEAIDLFPRTFRFYSALLYLYEETGRSDDELELSYKILSFMYADEEIRNRIMRILSRNEDESVYDFALETLYYHPENQRAINILSQKYPFFLSRALVNLTEDDLISYSLPLSNALYLVLLNPEGYKTSVLESLNGTLLSQAE